MPGVVDSFPVATASLPEGLGYVDMDHEPEEPILGEEQPVLEHHLPSVLLV